MDIFHKFFQVARKEKLHSAPFTPNYDGPRILDLGCGTGIWAIDMAEYVVQIWQNFANLDVGTIEEIF
jgi:ubiquinone/menaquinone biosynthesis C-methylase UbiE